MSLAIINSTSKALLKDAKAASLRRGSKVIREVDVTYAISRFKMVDSHKWYLIPVAGNGDCQCKFLIALARRPFPHLLAFCFLARSLTR